MPISSAAVENWGIILYSFTHTLLFEKLNSLFRLFGSIKSELPIAYFGSLVLQYKQNKT